MLCGWMLVGFSADHTDEVSDVMLDGRPVLLVRTDEGLRAFDGVCPHRGARLGCGGKRSGNSILCPFHGYAIALGQDPALPSGRLAVKEYPSLEVGQLIFVKLGDDAPDCGFADDIQRLKEDHFFVHGFTMPLPVKPQTVIENAFDTAHFGPVHNVPGVSRLSVDPLNDDVTAPFTARGALRAGASDWDAEPNGTPISIPYEARAYAPGVIISSQLGSNPYHFLVGATSDGEGGCLARVVLILPKPADGGELDMDKVEWLIQAMESQLAADREVWQHLDPSAPMQLGPEDAPIMAFWSFCELFEAEGP